ncbi:DUF3592 domain-containing protein [Roseibium sp. MMSF_3412]|uniref:DUF3592 domain-containing protein n=1 Tax=Roseibium sp. MMSF_3412 TaxID=3046712 RepID=UPI00273D36DA|nr:DUF3592 domain-containing protein [Roseibium sp. MMSF_3412]
MIEFLEKLIAGDRGAVILISAAYFALIGVYSLIHMYRISKWPSVIGKLHEENIQGSGVGSHDETNYRATVRYTYVVDGVPYENDKINPWIILLSHNLRALLNWQFRYIDRHDGSDVTVFYHPGTPEKAYLVVPGWKQMALVSALCFGVAALILLAL